MVTAKKQRSRKLQETRPKDLCLRLCSSSSLSTVSSTLNYDDCYIIANEKCMIEETRLHSRLG